MPSRFQTTFEERCQPANDRAFGVSVRLKRDAIQSAEFTAIWEAEEYKSLEEETGLAIVVRRRVYRFLKTSAVLAGDTVTPKHGDYIVDGDDELLICPFEGRPAVEELPGGYRWLVRTDKLA